jgi:hypothetical protein
MPLILTLTQYGFELLGFFFFPLKRIVRSWEIETSSYRYFFPASLLYQQRVRSGKLAIVCGTDMFPRTVVLSRICVFKAFSLVVNLKKLGDFTSKSLFLVS